MLGSRFEEYSTSLRLGMESLASKVASADASKLGDLPARMQEFVVIAANKLKAAATSGSTPAIAMETLLEKELLPQLAVLGREFATKTGTANPVDPYMPKEEFTIFTLIKWGIIVGIGYVGYKFVRDMTSDDYPRSRLPRYAGGRER